METRKNDEALRNPATRVGRSCHPHQTYSTPLGSGGPTTAAAHRALRRHLPRTIHAPPRRERGRGSRGGLPARSGQG
ncbi:hypothetical protein GQ55_3G280100 [Panicum hallii var. hallii]|uniref:Uncharacterized protein n=1 Tax=Panicum hallii var. hallii TaxID=1504633 RepID=A0A2T7EE46_9POAL|nr:hypothetical protein GQ55_3G280100 [Panicum hallii var. hallii]